VITLFDSLPLLAILKKQFEVCSRYLQIQKEMTDALITGDIKQIDRIVREEQTYIMKIESLEKQREQLLMKELRSGVTISEIIESDLEDSEKEPFKDAAELLVCVIKELKKVNDLNKRILKERLSVLEYLIEETEPDFVRRV
jgi:FlgN protein.